MKTVAETDKRRWEREVLEPTLAKSPERPIPFTTISGCSIDRLYASDDLQDLDPARDLSSPGQFPYTRGTAAQELAFTLRDGIEYSSASSPRRRTRAPHSRPNATWPCTDAAASPASPGAASAHTSPLLAPASPSSNPRPAPRSTTPTPAISCWATSFRRSRAAETRRHRGRSITHEVCGILGRVPRKIRQLVADLQEAGFALVPGGKGAHRKFRHSKIAGAVILGGADGDDAKDYQEKQVQRAIKEASK